MIFKKTLFTLLYFSLCGLVSLSYSYAQAPTTSNLSGTTTVIPSVEKENKPYSYEPVDVDYWAEVENEIKEENFIKLIEGGADRYADEHLPEDDQLEGLLASAIGLKNLKLYYMSSVVLKEIILKRLSSELAQKALFELSTIDEASFLDPVDMVDDLLNSNEFGYLHPEIQSFVSYYTSMSDLINGFKNWSDIERKKVKEESYWGQKISYLKALSEVAQDQVDKAEARFSVLSQSETTSQRIKERSELQIARISFERKDFIKASKTYKALTHFPTREKARVLLERAWSLYYLKRYSESLGLLKALKSPEYMVSAVPERYILEMIIYKQLCYFTKVSDVAKEFYSVFGKTLTNIRKRRDLKKDKFIVQIALLNSRLQDQANFINQLRAEAETVRDLKLDEIKYYKNILSLYKNKDTEVQNRLFFKMSLLFPQISNDLLDSEEQIKFLDYTAKLDALRITRKGEDRSYRSERISHIQFNKIYWEIEDEYWLDELDDYRVLLKSQCDSSMPSSSEDEDIIKQFGEEFK